MAFTVPEPFTTRLGVGSCHLRDSMPDTRLFSMPSRDVTCSEGTSPTELNDGPADISRFPSDSMELCGFDPKRLSIFLAGSSFTTI